MTGARRQFRDSEADEGGWSIVIPVRGGEDGKSRLQHPRRARLAAAFAHDTVSAAVSARLVREVVVVIATPVQLPRVRGVRMVPDPGGGLNAAIRSGFAASTDHRLHRAALLGDLPALSADDLDHALSRAALLPRAFVSDARGDGTTLVTARAGVAHDVAFGPGSARAHQDHGYRRLLVAQTTGLRCDIDEASDLFAILESRSLRLGPRTAAVLAGIAP